MSQTKKINKHKRKQNKHNKKQLSFNAEVFEIEFHRTQDLFAVGLVTGESFLYKYPSLENASNSETQQPTVVHHWKDIHSESVRGLQFAARGNCTKKKKKEREKD